MCSGVLFLKHVLQYICSHLHVHVHLYIHNSKLYIQHADFMYVRICFLSPNHAMVVMWTCHSPGRCLNLSQNHDLQMGKTLYLAASFHLHTHRSLCFLRLESCLLPAITPSSASSYPTMYVCMYTCMYMYIVCMLMCIYLVYTMYV